MMTPPVAGIDPHQDSYTIGITDPNGIELTHQTFPTSAAGYVDGIELLTAHGVEVVGIEGSAGWGAHAAIALCAAGFDCREVPAPEASWIFTANDIKVNLLVIVAAIAVAATESAAPNLIAGGIIFLIVANGARRILAISRS